MEPCPRIVAVQPTAPIIAYGGAGLRIEALEEYPHTIAIRFNRMREISDDRVLPPKDVSTVPLLYGLRARKP
jgi:hypothetical protein